MVFYGYLPLLSGKRLHNYGKIMLFVGQLTISMAIFNICQSLPEGKYHVLYIIWCNFPYEFQWLIIICSIKTDGFEGISYFQANQVQTNVHKWTWGAGADLLGQTPLPSTALNHFQAFGHNCPERLPYGNLTWLQYWTSPFIVSFAMTNGGYC